MARAVMQDPLPRNLLKLGQLGPLVVSPCFMQKRWHSSLWIASCGLKPVTVTHQDTGCSPHRTCSPPAAALNQQEGFGFVPRQKPRAAEGPRVSASEVPTSSAGWWPRGGKQICSPSWSASHKTPPNWSGHRGAHYLSNLTLTARTDLAGAPETATCQSH